MMSMLCPAVNPREELTVRVIADPLVSVTILPRSDVRRVYEVV
jgi:hypothetical protein